MRRPGSPYIPKLGQTVPRLMALREAVLRPHVYTDMNYTAIGKNRHPRKKQGLRRIADTGDIVHVKGLKSGRVDEVWTGAVYECGRYTYTTIMGLKNNVPEFCR